MYLPRVLPHFLHINFATGETRNGSVVRGRPASEAFQQLAKQWAIAEDAEVSMG